MKKNIASAIAKLQRSGDQKNNVSFSYKGMGGVKTVKGNIFFGESQNIDLDITTIHGYNPKYIRTRAKTLLREISNEVLQYVGSGDQVWTKSYLDDLQPGDPVTLSGNDYYYAVNNGIIDCNGREFGRSYPARFVSYDYASCRPGGSIMQFSIFILQ